MKDIVFFPLIVLVALAIIAAAALPGRDRLSCGSVSGAGTNYKTVSVTGDDLCRMEAAGQANIDLNMDDNEVQSALIEVDAGRLGDRPERNPHFRLAADLEAQYAGFRMRITVEAKPGEDAGAEAFEVNYSAGQEGNSGWRRFNLKPEYDSYSFEWDVPQRMIEDQAVDYLAIRPVVPDKSRTVLVRSVIFERLGRTKAPATASES